MSQVLAVLASLVPTLVGVGVAIDALAGHYRLRWEWDSRRRAREIAGRLARDVWGDDWTVHLRSTEEQVLRWYGLVPLRGTNTDATIGASLSLPPPPRDLVRQYILIVGSLVGVSLLALSLATM